MEQEDTAGQLVQMYKALHAQQEKRRAAQTELAAKQTELAAKQTELAAAQGELAAAQGELQAQQVGARPAVSPTVAGNLTPPPVLPPPLCRRGQPPSVSSRTLTGR